MSKKTIRKWEQAFRIALPIACITVLAFVIRWSTWNDAFQAGRGAAQIDVKAQIVEAARQAYEFGKRDGSQSCPKGAKLETEFWRTTVY